MAVFSKKCMQSMFGGGIGIDRAAVGQQNDSLQDHQTVCLHWTTSLDLTGRGGRRDRQGI